MAKHIIKIFAMIFALQLLISCSSKGDSDKKSSPQTTKIAENKKIPSSKSKAVAYPKATKKVYLTFDDGPSVYTPKIINILKQYNAKATFFDIGINARRYPQYEKLVIQNRMKIGNHSYKHDDYKNFSSGYIDRDLKRTSSIIKANIGSYPKCMRPPYGATTYRINRIIKNNHMTMELWDRDSLDWSRPGVKRIINNSLNSLQDGDVILMHAGGGDRSETIAALPKILSFFRANGYGTELLKSC